MRKILCVATLLALLPATAAFALRCGLELAQEGDLKHQIRMACGEPISHEIIGYIDEERDGDRIRVLQVEEWIIEQSGYYYRLIFEGNVLKRIQNAGEVKR